MLLALLLALSMAAPAVNGVVRDTSGGVVPGASVTIQSTSGREQQTVISGSDGRFTFETVPAGEVVLVIRAGGFAEAPVVGATLSGSTVSCAIRCSCTATSEAIPRSAAGDSDGRQRRRAREGHRWLDSGSA